MPLLGARVHLAPCHGRPRPPPRGAPFADRFRRIHDVPSGSAPPGRSGSAASTTLQPLLLRRSEDFLEQRVGDAIRCRDRDRPRGGRRCRRSRRPGRMAGGRAPPHRPPRAGLRRRRCSPAGGRPAVGAGPPSSSAPAALGRRDDAVAERDEPIDVRDAGRADQVFHAGWTPPRRAGGAAIVDDRAPIDSHRIAGGTSRGGERKARQPRPGRAGRCCNRSADAMIRHRFGGNLRAARASVSCAVVRHCTAARPGVRRTPSRGRGRPTLGSGHGQRAREREPARTGCGGADRDRPGGSRPIGDEEESG